jgi:hypothetical protein
MDCYHSRTWERRLLALILCFAVHLSCVAQEPEDGSITPQATDVPATEQPFTPQGQPSTEEPISRFYRDPSFQRSETAPAPRTRPAEQPSPIVDSTGPAEASFLSPTEAGALLRESASISSVSIQRRSAISLEPYIRGYRSDQIYTQADGAHHLPIRRDLDSLISRIDPGLIREARVIPGPYGVRYGPGFSFIDVSTIETPRYDSLEHHWLTGLTTRSNGGQILFRETLFGGNKRHGYIGSFTTRKGSDYSPGDAAPVEKIPSSYDVMSGFFKYSKDLSPETRFEIQYDRLDEWDTEYPAQFFDINHLATDMVIGSYIVDNPYEFSSCVVDGWYSFSRLNGDTLAGGKSAPFSVIDRVEKALENSTGLANVDFTGFTFGHLGSAGVRIRKQKGEEGKTQFSHGADLRFTRQAIGERFDSNVIAVDDLQTNLPTAFALNPGMFAELTLPWKRLNRLTTNIGGRVDFVHTDAAGEQIPDNSSLLNRDQLDQDDVLWAAYLSNDLILTDQLTFTLAGGHAERVPSLVDRYASGLFLALMQTGFNRVVGEPTLDKERNWQADAGLKYTGDTISGSLN